MALIPSAIDAGPDDGAPNDSVTVATYVPTLKKIPPYWYPYRTFAKERWWNREILELVSTEFRDRSVEYYVCMLCGFLLLDSESLTFVNL